jgi:hypothetical protein
MRSTRARLAWLVGWASLTGCLSLGAIDCGFRAQSGARCDPFSSATPCLPGDFCALTETCTRACTSDDACRTPCTVAVDGGLVSGCGAFEACVGGVCESSQAMRCVDGFCQGNCASTLLDGGCDYDVYGPRSFGDES